MLNWKLYDTSARAETPFAWLTVDKIGERWEASIQGRLDWCMDENGFADQASAQAWCAERYAWWLCTELQGVASSVNMRPMEEFFHMTWGVI